MGSKSSDAPAPDPRLVDAQIRSMGVQEAAIGKLLDQSGRLLPLQEQQLQFGLDAAKTAYGQSQDDRAYSLERRAKLTGMQDKLIDEAATFNTEARGDELAGKAVAGVGQQFDAAGDIARTNLTRAGVNPTSGAFAGMSKQLAIARALGQAGAGTAARADARKEGYALTDRAANALAGYPAMSQSTTGQGAQYGTGGLSLVNAGADGMTSGYSKAAGIAGQMGNNATGMWGQQANYQVQQDKNSGLDLGGIGTLLGGATQAAKFFSDRRLKTDIVRISDDPRGFGWYQFRYRWGGPVHTGVMADEVALVIPAAVSDVAGYKAVRYNLL